MRRRDLPLVLYCDGCSLAALLAQRIAARLVLNGVASTAKAYGSVSDRHLVDEAVREGRELVALDACELRCAKEQLERRGVHVQLALSLSDYGVDRLSEDPLPVERADQLTEVVASRVDALTLP